MPRITARRIVAAVSLATAAGLAIAFAPTSFAGTTDAPTGLSMVGVGDSYAAGTGAPPYKGGPNDKCKRSWEGYPAVFAQAHSPDFTYTACADAKTADIPGQFSKVDPKTQLVTLTVGANDLDVEAGIGTCVFAADDKACQAVADQAKAFTKGELVTRLDAMYAAIHTATPTATVVTVGYPQLFETDVDECPGMPLNAARRAMVNDVVDTLDSVLADRAAAAHGLFSDVRRNFFGHGVCGTAPWITDLKSQDPLHPTRDGYRQGYVPALEATLSGAIKR